MGWLGRRLARPAGATVLVADDDADIRRALAVRLRGAGFQVIEAASGSEALRLARQALPALVLLDIKMPAGDGFTVLERLRADPAAGSAPVLFLTANPQAANRERAMQMGAAGFLPKPYDGAELIRVVRRVLEGGREEDQVPAGGVTPGPGREET